MRIPVGTFGNALPDQVQPTNVGGSGLSELGKGIASVGRAMGEVKQVQRAAELDAFAKAAADERAAQQALAQEQDRKRQVTDGIEALKVEGSAELAASALAESIGKLVKTGELSAEDARIQYLSEWGKTVNDLSSQISNPERQQEISARLNNHGMRSVSRFYGLESEALDSKQRAGLQELYSQGLQLYAQNPDQAEGRFFAAVDASNLAPDERVRLKQDFRQHGQMGQVGQAMNNATTAEALTALQDQLRNPEQFTSIDPARKESLWASAQSKKDQLLRAQQVVADKREQEAESAMRGLQSQILTGAPIDPARLSEVAGMVSGTKQADAFNQWQKLYGAVQKYAGLPLPAMAQELRTMEAALQNQQTKNPQVMKQVYGLLSQMYDTRTTQARDEPLRFAQAQTGLKLAPLDMSKLVTPQGQQEFVRQLHDRQNVVAAAQRTNGAQVGGNVLFPEEQAQVQKMLTAANDEDKLGLLSALAKGSGAVSMYRQTLKELAGNDEGLLIAGLMQASGVATKNTRGRNVPLLILHGQRIRADKTFGLPPDAEIDAAVNAYLGGAVLPGTEEHGIYLKATRMIYASLAAQAGQQYDRGSKLVAPDAFRAQFSPTKGDAPGGLQWGQDQILQTAIEFATGGVSEYNGGKVIRPYGMDEAAFLDQVDKAVRHASQTQGVSLDQLQDMKLVRTPVPTVFQIADGAGGVQRRPDGRPVVIAVDPSVGVR